MNLITLIKQVPLLLLIGLSFSIAGIFLIKNARKRKTGWICIISGVWLMVFYLVYFLLDVKPHIMMQIFLLIMVWAITYESVKNRNPLFKKPIDRQDNNINWRLFTFGFVIVTAVFIIPARFPTVKMKNDVIRMGGFFGGNFKISDIQSVDTVRVFPNVLLQYGGSGAGSLKGNYKLKDEQRLAKLHIITNNPPYIAIRMNDNRLFLFNFKKPEETVEFYKKIKSKSNNSNRYDNNNVN